MKKIKLVIFDLDGTLINAYAAVASSINFTMTRMGLPKRDPYEIKRSVGWGDKRLLRKFVGDERFDEAVKIYRAHHASALTRKGTRFLSGAGALLRQLKKEKYKLAIATNRPSRFTHIILRYLKVNGFFDAVLCADQIKKGKPHPMILRQLLKKFSLKPAQALYVGDMSIDVETGRNAKVRTVAVATGSCTRRELTALKPYRVLARISGLTAVLSELEKPSQT